MVKELLKQRARSERGEIYITALANVNLQNKEGAELHLCYCSSWRSRGCGYTIEELGRRQDAGQ